MKKAEDICKELNWTFDSDPSRYNLFLGLIAPAIKLAQLNAIEETCKFCAKNAEVNLYYKGLYKGAKWHKLEEGDSYNPLENNIMSKLDKKSILNCADILKKELE